MQNLQESGRIGKRGVLTIPAALRRLFGLDEGSYVLVESTQDGILIRPAELTPVEIYTPSRKAEFLLNSAMDEAEYLAARETVASWGIDPDSVPHESYK